jgi:Zn-dependent protease with chaperone function
MFPSSQPDASTNTGADNMGAEPQSNSALTAGLTALKQKNYEAAIAHFQAVAATQTHPAAKVKAQTGLVIAHQRLGQLQEAIALCQPLLDSRNAQVQQWAMQTLNTLIQQQIQQQSVTAAHPSTHRSLSDDSTASTNNPLEGEAPSPDDAPPGRNTAGDFADLQAFMTTVPARPRPKAAQSAADSPALPATTVDPPSDPTVTSPIAWRQAERASKWRSLGSVNRIPLWLLEAGTAIALWFVLKTLWYTIISTINQILQFFYFPIDLRYSFLYYQAGWTVAIVLAVFVLVSPFAFDWILSRFYGAEPLALDALATRSPESARVLKRLSGQHRQPLPVLRRLPTTAPIALTYGLPRYARLAVSNGLLEQLNDDEIAAILAGEMAHIIHWDFAILSPLAFVAQMAYLLYWPVAIWADRQSNRVLRGICVGLSSIGYGLFWLIRWVGLWLSRVRLLYSDRAAAESTGNPNGLTRAILKITLGMAEELQRQGQTSALLESLDLLMPVGYRTALTLGSVYPYAPLDELLMWDKTNPYRYWLVVNQAHPLMGDRLEHLTHYARYWQLETELSKSASSQPAQFSPSTAFTRRFLLQMAPLVGAVAGVGIAFLLWVLGGVATWLTLYEFSWMQGDWSLVWGCLLAGFSFGAFLRINPYFPNLTSHTLNLDPALPDLLASLSALPIDSQPIRVRGILLGRSGISNILNQDLILKKDTGLIKLHYRSQFGPLGELFPKTARPGDFVNRSVTVSGWLRRGATPWIDIDTLQPQVGPQLQSGHPVWATLFAFTTALIAALIILRGGI